MTRPYIFEDWAEKYEKFVHYTQNFLNYNEEYREDCLNIPSDEILKKWGIYSWSDSPGHQATITTLIAKVLPSADKTHLDVSIDLTAPTWALIYQLEYLIEAYKRTRKIAETKIQWEKLDIYLRVLKLLKEGKDTDAIAKHIYPDEYERANQDDDDYDIESLKRTVRNHITRANEIQRTGTIW